MSDESFDPLVNLTVADGADNRYRVRPHEDDPELFALEGRNTDDREMPRVHLRAVLIEELWTREDDDE